MSELRRDWSKGIDNVTDRRRLPSGGVVAGQQQPGTVRELVNLDPHSDGTLKLRTGYTKRYSGTAVHGLLALGDTLLIADGGQLIEYHVPSAATRALGAIPADGLFCGCELNGELLISTASQTLRYDGARLRDWGVPTVTVQPLPDLVAGGLEAGTYLVACTLVNAEGEEGGTATPLPVTVPAGSGLSFALPAPTQGGSVRLYASAANGATLYLQAQGTGNLTLTTVTQDSARLETAQLRAPLISQQLVPYNGVALMVTGALLSWTLPFRTHLRDPLGYVQFPEPIDLVAPIDTANGQGVYVCAGDATYFLASLETTDVAQQKVAEYGGVPGTVVTLTDGRATWMTRYGQVIGAPGGTVQRLGDRFVPEAGQSGAATLLERDGQQLIVTAMRATPSPSGLAAGDYYLSEIITHEA